ncbi:MAG: heavy metal translocating P-type ATPase metal-binding domain-containing protein [Bacteroidales bacterium]|nr:heavy metal translocating P-type ATPase metal-binding domain-containing protein [Bacteroidales bacterium]
MGLKCVHCGEDCGKNPIMRNDIPFCCNGCKTVCQLINQNKLYKYYNLEDSPGIKIETQDFDNKYAYLDKDEVKEKLYEFKEGNIVKVTFYVPTIHCVSCVWLLENLHTLNNGISFSMVNFIKKEVSVTFNEKEISLRQVVELMSSIHYIPKITLEERNKYDERKEENKRLLKKIGVAGFAFGNTMLLSFPEYIQGSFGLEEKYKFLFGILNLLFAIPVIAYSGSDYIKSAFKNLFKKIINIDLPVAVGMSAIFLQSSYEILSRSGSGYMDSLTGFTFFLLIGKWFQNKTYTALSFERDYKSYFPIAVTILEGDEEDSVLLENLKAGQKILVRNQELIPADSKLLKGEAYIDYSFVTGESQPVKKEVGDNIFAGGRQTGEALELQVEVEVMQSKLTKLWNQESNNELKTKNLGSIVDKVSKYFTVAVLIIAVITGIAWLFINPSIAMKAFTSVLIVACPCALALSLPFTYGTTMSIFGKNGFYLKKTDVVEKLSKIDTIVFDKTGTITESGGLKVEYRGEELSNEELSMIKSITRQSTHPMSSAIYEYLKKHKSKKVNRFREFPARGVVGEFDNVKVKAGSAEFVGFENNLQEAKASSVYISINEKVKGCFSVENKYRKGLDNIISELEKKYHLHLISGDNQTEEQNLLPLFKKNNRLNFNLSPVDKLNYVKLLKDTGSNVLMIGDGLNDSGALTEANAGISIADDIYHFSPACDAILDAGKFQSLNKFIKFSKTVIKIVYACLAISFIYNIIGLYFAVSGMLSPIIAAVLMPASSISVVAFASFSVILMSKLKKLKN